MRICDREHTNKSMLVVVRVTRKCVRATIGVSILSRLNPPSYFYRLSPPLGNKFFTAYFILLHFYNLSAWNILEKEEKSNRMIRKIIIIYNPFEDPFVREKVISSKGYA